MSQFIIRFQSLQLQIATKIPNAELKDIVLEAIQEPLQTTLAVFDFSDQTIDKVIDKSPIYGSYTEEQGNQKYDQLNQ